MMKKCKLSVGSVFLALGALSGLILLLMRVSQVISLHEAQHVVTSGFEEESLYAMWKFLHGLPIYSDPHQIPFAASYFNWLFYSIYGYLIQFFTQSLVLGDDWIPTIGRGFTLVVVGLGFLVNFRLFTNKNIAIPPLPLLIGLSLSALLWFGPLIGFWAMTVRPDVLALFFDLCAVYCLLRYFPRKLVLGVVLAAFWCYLSWACKQVNIVMPVAIGLFLLIQKRWQAFILFSMLIGAGFAMTFLLANYNLIKTLLFVNTAVPLSFDVLGHNLLQLIKKTFPVWLLFVAVLGKALFCNQYRQRIFQDKMVQLSLCGLFAWALILLPASSKVGSADNYHFIALFFLLLGTGGALRYVLDSNAIRVAECLAIAGILCAGSIIVVLGSGSLASIQNQHKDNLALKQCLSGFPQPIFIANHYGALPWMNSSSLSFVLAFNYWSDRNDNRPFEHNGVGGLIQQGYFHTLVLPQHVANYFDGAALTDFERKPNSCVGYTVFMHKDKA